MSSIVTRSSYRQALLATATALLVSLPAHAEDISVYTAQLAARQKPNILFVLDYSGSMKKDIYGNKPKNSGLPAKIDILKDAVNSVIDRYAGEVNVGLGSLYRSQPSGVRWPISDLNADAHTIDPNIPAGKFKVKEIIKKQLNRTSPGDYTSTVNALVDAALYFRGAPVTHNDAELDYPWAHKPDVWDNKQSRYNHGNIRAAIAASYSPSDAYKRDVFDKTQKAYCSDYSPSGGKNYCAGKSPFDCTDKKGGEWSNEGGSGSYGARKVCKFIPADRWDGANYISPISHECQANSIILISDGKPTRLHDNVSLKNVVGTDASACEDLSGSVFGAGPGGKVEGNCGVEVVRELATNKQVDSIPDSMVRTYTVGFSVKGPGQNYLKRLAEASVLPDGKQGKFYDAGNPEELEVAINDAVSDSLGDSENFAELAIDVNKATFSHDNRAFFNLFKPSPKRTWAGNLKGYFIEPIGLVDTNKLPAIVTDKDGTRFDHAAQSFWSADPDGNTVAAGGASELLLGGDRKLYTYTKSDKPLDVPLTTGQTHRLLTSNKDVSDALLDLPPDSPARKQILDWVQTAPMGDPLHSKSVTVTYEKLKGKETIVYAMTNQGFLHAFDATNPIDPGNHDGGKELFAFMPQDLLANLKDIYANSDVGGHIYGLDGALTRWHDDLNHDGIVNGKDRLLLVFGMRRGGSSYYALDVTNPRKPRFAWRIDAGKDGFDHLAQTWSRSSLITINYGGKKKRVMAFGGGYDAKVLDGVTGPTESSGNAVYMIDINGKKVASVSGATKGEMKYALASDLTTIDSDGNGVADRLYVGDLGGQVWRIDFEDVKKGLKATPLANLAGGAYQPFFYAPSVALNRSPTGDYLSVALGSGNRTQPLLANSANAFFMLRDEDVEVGEPTSGVGILMTNDLYNATANSIGSTEEKVANAAKETLATKNGWYIKLDTGEKSLSRIVSFEGKLLATTFQADISATSNPCEFNPTGQFYLMDIGTGQPVKYLDDGSASDEPLTAADRSRNLDGRGIPSSPVIVFPEGSNRVQVVVDKETVNLIDQTLTRVFWHSK